ncbi:MAG: hypothetical protein ACFFF4_01045 [Candidatus Thorarchaeota archaeon]
MSLVMLLKTKVRHENIEKLAELRSKFNEVYADHGIEVLGHYNRIDKPTTTYTMIRYEDEADYNEKVAKLRADERYVNLSKELHSIRKDFKMKRLTPA